MQIFAYLKTAEIAAEDLQAARDAGLVPVAVDSYDDIKVIETNTLPSGPEVDPGLMLQAALEAIKDSSSHRTREEFATNLIDLVSTTTR